MKVISSYRDYYDTVDLGQQGTDVRFRREPRLHDVSAIDGFVETFSEFIEYGFPYSLARRHHPNSFDERVIQTNLVVGFCGEIFWGYRFTRIAVGVPVKSTTVYSQSRGAAYLNSIDGLYHTEGFEFIDPPLLAQDAWPWFTALDAPIFVYPGYASDANEMNTNWDQNIPVAPIHALVNAPLGPLNFQTVKPPYSCHLGIQEFLEDPHASPPSDCIFAEIRRRNKRGG